MLQWTPQNDCCSQPNSMCPHVQDTKNRDRQVHGPNRETRRAAVHGYDVEIAAEPDEQRRKLLQFYRAALMTL